VERGIRPVAHIRGRSNTALIDRLGLEKRTFDLEDPSAADRLVEGIESVIHTAAWVNFRQDQLSRFMDINTHAALRLFQAAQRKGVKRFVQVSSIVGIGGLPRGSGKTVSEMDERFEFNLAHLNIPYIISKHTADEQLLAASRNGKTELIVTHLPKLLSPSRSGNDRSSAESFLGHRVLPRLSIRFNLADIRDSSRGVITALEKGRPGERYFLGGENLSYREAIQLFADHLHLSPRLLPVPKSLFGAAAWLAVAAGKLRGKKKISFYPDLVKMLDYDWTCSSEKARQDFGYTYRPLRETVADLLALSHTKAGDTKEYPDHSSIFARNLK
jgi:dihydroflavonol-4-reductase